jgi:aldehyde:ferredoxin oxidoreductase
MKGFYNRILHINVSDQSYDVEPLDDTILPRFLGGKGLATYLLLHHNPPGIDPLSAENRLILATGPVSGTPVDTGFIQNHPKPVSTLNHIPAAQPPSI